MTYLFYFLFLNMHNLKLHLYIVGIDYLKRMLPLKDKLMQFKNKGNNKITELRAIFQRERQNS